MLDAYHPNDFYFSLPINNRPLSVDKQRRIQDAGRQESLKNYWQRRTAGGRHGVRVLRPSELGILFHYLVAADDLDDVFKRMQSYYFMLLERVGKGLFRYRRYDDRIELCIDNLWIRKTGEDLSLCAFQSIEPIVYFIQWLIDERQCFAEIEVPWSRKCDANPFVARHTRSIIHDSRRLCFVLDREISSKRVVRRPQEIAAFLMYLPCYLALGYFESSASENYMHGFVRKFIASHQRAPQLADLANVFGLSISSVKRHLSARKILFNDIVKATLCEASCALLSEETMPIKEVASRLGYQDHNAFRRAFKAWTGIQPSRWRLENRSTVIASQQRSPDPGSRMVTVKGCTDNNGHQEMKRHDHRHLNLEYRRRMLTNYVTRRRGGARNGCRVMRPKEIDIMYHYLVGGTHLRETLRRLKRFTYLLRERLTLENLIFKEQSSGESHLEIHYAWDPDLKTMYQDATLESLQSLLYFMQWSIDSSIHFDYIQVPWSESPEYRRLLRPLSERVYFGCTAIRVGFSDQHLSMPVVRSSLELHAFHANLPLYCEYGFGEAISFRDHVLHALEWLHPRQDELPTIKEISTLFGVSVNQVRRKLKAEGVVYRQILSQYKFYIARRLLTEEGVTIKELAFRFRYRDPNSFRRAFKMWGDLASCS